VCDRSLSLQSTPLQCVAVCCSVLQCVAVCYKSLLSVLYVIDDL